MQDGGFSHTITIMNATFRTAIFAADEKSMTMKYIDGFRIFLRV